MTEFKALCALLENYNLQPQSYSGRFMYGKSCVGVIIENTAQMNEVIFSMGMILGNPDQRQIAFNINSDMCTALSKAIKKMRYDNMGLQFIMYFPDVEWVEEHDAKWERDHEKIIEKPREE